MHDLALGVANLAVMRKASQIVVEILRFSWYNLEKTTSTKEGLETISFRHGGDFVGLTSKLPYIKGLGCEVGVKQGVKHGVSGRP